ncbi:MAG: hypothetical protein M3440_02450 [Chloroflexota bacterium]|nr:hypothetical protein [Chloroflexota bacterium]
MLALLVALIVMMPVSYRAGTDASHAHTIFQGLIDMMIGQPHHHHGEHDHGDSPGNAEHAVTGSSDGASGSTDPQVAERLEPNATSPDMPTLLGLSSPIDATAAIHALGALIASMLSGSAQRSLRASVRPLDGLTLLVDSPPPRLALVRAAPRAVPS